MDFHHWFHVLVSLFGSFGWLIVPKVHAPFCAGVLMHWITNGNRCILSQGYEDTNGFTQSLVESVGFKWPESKIWQNIIPYVLLLVPMMISVLRVLVFGGSPKMASASVPDKIGESNLNEVVVTPQNESSGGTE